MVDKNQFRDAMAHLPAAVNILTSAGPSGRAGLTATAVSSVTDEPGTLLVCVNRSGRARDIFLGNGVFCVNTLSSEQADVSDVFAREPDMDTRFTYGEWTALETGSPALVGATIVFDCKIVASSDVGTHTVIFGEVQSVKRAENPTGLLYFGRGYHKLALS